MTDVGTKRNLITSIAVIALLLAGPVLRAGAAPCGHTACKDEVALSGLTGGAKSGCFKAVISACKAGTCDCGGGANVCGSCGDMIGSLCPGGASGSCPPTTTTTTTGKTPPRDTEFGRKIWYSEVDGGLISDYRLLRGNPPDNRQWVASPVPGTR